MIKDYSDISIITLQDVVDKKLLIEIREYIENEMRGIYAQNDAFWGGKNEAKRLAVEELITEKVHDKMWNASTYLYDEIRYKWILVEFHDCDDTLSLVKTLFIDADYFLSDLDGKIHSHSECGYE